MIRIAYDQIKMSIEKFTAHLTELINKDEMFIISSDKYNLKDITLLEETKIKYLIDYKTE